MGKGADVQAPDPRLIDAQIKSLGVQDQAIQYMIDTSKDLAPMQRQMMEDSIGRSRTLWEQSQEDREFALGKRAQLSGIQDAIARESATFNTEDRRAELAGQAGADISQSFASARDQLARERSRMGVNPNDGRAMAMQGQMATQEALAQATGRTMAGRQATDERRQLQDRANNALSGYPSMSANSVGMGAGVAGMGQQALAQGQSGLLAPSQAIGQAAGSSAATAGNIWGQQNQAYQQSLEANAAGGQAVGGAIGSIAMAVAI